MVQCTPHAPFDWPTLAALMLIKRGRPFAVQADWDLWSTIRLIYEDIKNPAKRARKYLHTRIFLRRYRTILEIGEASVALLHGNDVFEANKNLTPNPRLIHNPSVDVDDQICQSELMAKTQRLLEGEPLRIVYAGRTEAMKGPLDWLASLASARDQGLEFTADWYGSGSMETEFKTKMKELKLEAKVQYHGKVARSTLFDALRASDVFLFCHKIRESPRNLIEALACGLPIIGYHSPYAKDLSEEYGGSVLHPVGEVAAVAASLLELDENRERLRQLVEQATASGVQYTRQAAIAERAGLMLEYASMR